jgi:dTDP-4-amino-4,6-dideoxygalactose transaminase
VDVDENMNLDLDCVEAAITKKTKVVVAVHYGGLSCDMDRLMMLSQKYNFYVVEDAAQSIGAYYKNKALGTWGHLGCLSFHHTKNIQTGEGGLLLVNEEGLIDRVQAIIDHGTNRQDFFMGKVSAYTWQCLGGAFRMDPLRANLLKAQWAYMDAFSRKIPENAYYNGHLFYIVLNSESDSKEFVERLGEQGIEVLPHYQPLHESAMGIKYGCFVGKNINTVKAHRLYRLPLHHDISLDQAKYIVDEVKKIL